MKKWLVVLLILPVFAEAQSKRKLRVAAEKEKTLTESNLQKHVQYLADDKLEGRRTGTAGELLAMEYITAQYKSLGIEPKGTNGFVQEFEINEGLQLDEQNRFKINGQALMLQDEYFPLAFSARKSAQGKPALALSEPGQPWFKDLKEVLEENKQNPHFDIEEAIKKLANDAAVKKATAFIIYNSGTQVDNVQFNKNDVSQPLAIPVIYVKPTAVKKYFSDLSASLQIELQVSLSNKVRKARNIIAYINNNAANTVVLGAHYDHLGYGEDKNALDAVHEVHNGADDNASGTAALLELARKWKTQSPKQNNYLLMHFSGEELGLMGSKYWLENPTIQTKANYMINMDMVGRYDTARKLTIGGYGTSPVWGNMVPELAKNLAFKLDSAGTGPSDHASFYRKDIPVLFFFTGSHPDYHKASDDWEKINYKGINEIVQLVYKIVETTDAKGKIEFTKTREQQMGRSTRFTVSLGVIPDYGYTGTGMRIDGASAGKLAEKIGLKAGDVLLQLGDYKFVDVNSYMQSLSKFKKGDKTKLIYKRGTEEISVEIEF
ncbi:M20/M25/M40 family metallo-hydrolase [Sediminibacterium salmoneum]|uniref:M20/M25/M40 family metallo-hydrolase n=1 Tax=Sediminibacterium salmoneum TaxID=426421 RepID=UPI0004B7D6FD|nr:M20/M25/M40 family metallo-hydrolase [Sediminibacterium salmoneum]